MKAYASAVYAFLYLPIVVLVVYSFNRDGVGGFPPQHWTLDWYRVLVADSAMWSAVSNSAIVALSTVVLSMLVGFPAAYALDRYSFPGKAALQQLVLLPLIVPGVITGISLLLLAVSSGLHLSLFIVILGHSTALTAVATTEILAGLTKLDRSLEEASADLGATQFQTLTRIVSARFAEPLCWARRCWSSHSPWMRLPSPSSLLAGRTPCRSRSGRACGVARPRK